MSLWSSWKKGFDAWENATAQQLEVWLKSPALLTPSGALLTVAMKAKARASGAVAGAIGALGLPTRRDQERTLHLLNQLNSRLHDLEEKIDAQRER